MNAYAETLNGVGVVNYVPLLIARELVTRFPGARCLRLSLGVICRSSGTVPKRIAFGDRNVEDVNGGPLHRPYVP